MGKITRIIPFGMWPANWGLTGKRREEALAEYYWDGEDLAYKLLDIKFDDTGSKEYITERLKLDYRYHKINPYEYGLGMIENNPTISETERDREMAKYQYRHGKMTAEELEYKLFDLSYELKNTDAYKREKLRLDVHFGKKTQEEADHELLDMEYPDKASDGYKKALLNLEFKYGNISQNDYDRDMATINKEPWFDFKGADKRISGNVVQAAVELDWNPYFVEFLEQQGWTGATPDEIVDSWFENMMKQMLNVFEEDIIDDGTADPMPMAGRGNKRDDGLTEYH